VIHWVPAAPTSSAKCACTTACSVPPNPEKTEDGGSFLDNINPDSLQVLTGCRAEPSLGNAQPDRFQFEREGYFAPTSGQKPGQPVFNRTVTLRDSWGQ
jgi:glutaminyl-tRNA synthetase